MKRRIVKHVVFGALLAFSLVCQQAVADGESRPLAREDIVSVYDGDTITITWPGLPQVFGERLGVRIRGYDTPERHSRCTDPVAKAREQALAMQAREELVSMLDSGPPIELRNLGRDKYFRLLAEVWVGEQNVGDMLIRQGLAVPYQGATKNGWCQASRE